MIEQGRTYLIMGLLDTDSIAYAIGRAVERRGGKVVYTVQNAVLKSRYLDGSKELTQEQRASMDVRSCDITVEDEVRDLFAGLDDLAGVVHSIAYANPRTCLGYEFHTCGIDEIMKSYHISAASLATVAAYAQPKMPEGGSLLALSFDTRHAYPFYNWMGVHKAALEALVRALARRHGRDLIRVNALSSGPLKTKAASRITGFDQLLDCWSRNSPLPWDPEGDRHAVADTAAFLLGPASRKITGQIIAVDGGAGVMGHEMLEHERPGGPMPETDER